MQHVDIAVSIENPKYSSTKLRNIEKDIDAILDVSLKEGTCERYLSALKLYKLTQYGGVNHLVGVSGWNSSDGILGFTCVVMPRNELRLSTEDGEDNIIFALLLQS